MGKDMNRAVRLLLTAMLLISLQASADSGVGGLSFRNLANRPMMMYWVASPGNYKRQARIEAGGQTGFQTYAGHQFIWAELESWGAEPRQPVPVSRFQIRNDQMIYSYTDDTTPQDSKRQLKEEMTFRTRYHAENGHHWVATSYPRSPVTLPMLRPTAIGEILTVNLTDPKASRWRCPIQNPKTHSNTECIDGTVQSVPAPPFEQLEIHVVSTHPRVFEVKDFLSDFEAEYMIAQVKSKLVSSQVGHGVNAQVDNTRRSKSAWLQRSHSEVMDSVYRRVAAVTGLPEDLVSEQALAESLNVLNYPEGAEYTPHYDWTPDGNAHSRWLSGLIYLNTPSKGGATSFPKARMGAGKIGTKVAATKRSLVFFYNLLEDGNGDVLSLHAGLPVTSSEKWVAPLWLWEPTRNGAPHGYGDISNHGMTNEQKLANSQSHSKSRQEPEDALSRLTKFIAGLWPTNDL